GADKSREISDDLEYSKNVLVIHKRAVQIKRYFVAPSKACNKNMLLSQNSILFSSRVLAVLHFTQEKRLYIYAQVL
ncbi:hypothetical protein XELAEV_18009619mg, partial [Xenopus laevis]